MANTKTKRPFDPAELERKAAMYQKWADETSLPEWKKIYEGRANRIRKVLAFMDKAGWNKRTALNTVVQRDHYEVR